MLQHLLGGVLLEVDQLKQFDLVTLRGEDQLVLLAAHTYLEGDLIKDQIQGVLHLGHEFCATGVILVLVHHLAQFCFHLGKGFPPVLCPFPGSTPRTAAEKCLSCTSRSNPQCLVGC